VLGAEGWLGAHIRRTIDAVDRSLPAGC